MIEPADLFGRHYWRHNFIIGLYFAQGEDMAQMMVGYSHDDADHDDDDNYLDRGHLRLEGITRLEAAPYVPKWDCNANLHGKIVQLTYSSDAAGHTLEITFSIEYFQPTRSELVVVSVTFTDIEWTEFRHGE